MAEEDVFSAVIQSMIPGASIHPLLLQKSNQVLLLHKVLNCQHENKPEMAQFLIESQLVDCDERNEDRQTAVECALIVQGDGELAKVMLLAELATLSLERSFYVMIRRGSVAVYRLFLELLDLDEEAIFQAVSNAMIELNARRVLLADELEVFVQYQLTNFAHNCLTGDVEKVKDPNEWRKHFVEIDEHWKVLKRKYNGRNYSQVDNEFVFRIKAIHNCFYFVKDKKFLRHLPITEVTFFVAALVEVIEGYSGVKMFNFLINKVNTLQFIGTISDQLNKVSRYLEEMRQNLKKVLNDYLQGVVHTREQLKIIWTKYNPTSQIQENVLNKMFSGLKKGADLDFVADDLIASETYPVTIRISSRDRSMLRRLKRLFIRAKQLYSIQKCLFHIETIMDLEDENDSHHVKARAIQRLIQVLGESIKSTKNSLNIPKNTADILDVIMTNLFPDSNKYLREFFSHKYSLSKKLYPISNNVKLQTLAEHLDFVHLFFAIVFICSLLEASRVLVGTVRRCHNNVELKSLLMYVKDFDLLKTRQERYFEKVQQKMDNLRSTLASNANPNYMFSVTYLNNNFALKLEVLKMLQKSLLRNWPVSFQDIRDACFARTPIGTIHRMADCLLTMTQQREIYQKLHSDWLQNHMVADSMYAHSTEMIRVDNQVMAGILLDIERKVIEIQDTGCIESTRRILQDLCEEDPPEELVQILNKQLIKYYENIFAIDNKFMAIKKVFKAEKLSLNEEILQNMRIVDELELQRIFDELLDIMRQALNAYGIRTIDDLLMATKFVTPPVILALQSCMLELCEILITVDYYGDNFYLLKQRIPMIYGRNFRNALAHNAVSYNVLTSSGRHKVLINAVVLINSKVQLFKKQNSLESINFQFLGTEQLLECVYEQHALIDNFKKTEFDFDSKCRADIRGLHCGLHSTASSTLVPNLGLRYDLPLSLLIYSSIPEKNIQQALELIDRHFPEAIIVIESPKVCMFHALHEENYEHAFKILVEHYNVKNSLLPQAFFAWELIVDYLLTEMTDWNERDQLGRTVLHRLVQAGNYERVQLLLTVMPDVDVNARDVCGYTPLDYATSIGCSKCTKLLLAADAKISSTSRRLGIVCHLNESIPDLFRDFTNDFNSYFELSVRSNNLIAALHLVDECHLQTLELKNSLSLAVDLNRYELVKFILSHPEIQNNSDIINSALLSAINKRNLKVANLLLKSGASPNWILKDDSHKTAFQQAVKINSQKIISQMGNIELQIYKNDADLEHPMRIAVWNRSPKMVAYLTKMGFSLLDSGSILSAAVEQKDANMVEEIFAHLDAAFALTKAAQDPILRAVVGLLNRWRTMAYLEDPGNDLTTAMFCAVKVQSLELLEKLLDKSKEVRCFQAIFIKQIQIFESNKQVLNCVIENVQQHSIIFQKCGELMAGWNDAAVSCSRSEIQVTLNSKSVVRGFFIVAYNQSLTPIIESIEGILENVTLVERVFELVRQRLQHITFTIYGTLRLDTDVAIHHFIIRGSLAIILRSTASPSSLKSVVQFTNHAAETALHRASFYSGNINVLKLLLSYEADPLTFNIIGQTPLHLALMGKDNEQALFLLKYCIDHGLQSTSGVPATELPSNNKLRPLHLAAYTGKTQCVRLLLDCNVNTRAVDFLGLTAANYAVLAPYIFILKMLLDHDPELLNFRSQSGVSTAINETLLRYVPELKNLLDHDSELLNTRSKLKSRLIDNSIVTMHPELTQLIFQYKPDLSVKENHDCSPVEQAILHKNNDWVKNALKYAKANKISGIFSNKLGFPAFSLALTSSDLEIVQAVMEYEIEGTLNEEMTEHNLQKLKQVLIQPTTDNGRSPLHGAVVMQSMELIRFILECRSLYNKLSEDKLNLITDLLDWNENSPLDYAFCSGKEELVNELMKNL